MPKKFPPESKNAMSSPSPVMVILRGTRWSGPCGLGLVDGPGGGELSGAEITVCRVGSVDVVVDPPVLDDHSGLEQAVPLAAVEQLVAEAAVEALDPSVLPRRARVDEHPESQPVNRHQSATAWATNSGPLSNRTNCERSGKPVIGDHRKPTWSRRFDRRSVRLARPRFGGVGGGDLEAVVFA